MKGKLSRSDTIEMPEATFFNHLVNVVIVGRSAYSIEVHTPDSKAFEMEMELSIMFI